MRQNEWICNVFFLSFLDGGFQFNCIIFAAIFWCWIWTKKKFFKKIKNLDRQFYYGAESGTVRYEEVCEIVHPSGQAAQERLENIFHQLR